MRLVLSILYNTILRGTIVHRAVTAAMVRKNLSLWLDRAMVGAAIRDIREPSDRAAAYATFAFLGLHLDPQ